MTVEKHVLLKKQETEKKYFHAELKTKDSKDRIIRGFASTKFKDRHNDIVDPAAFPEAMELYMKNPIILLQHDSDRPIGSAINWQITDEGLFIEARIVKGEEHADRAWKLIEQGVLKAFSIGFFILEEEYDKDHEAYIIKKLELAETSIVSIPANRESLFSVVKAARSGNDLVDRDGADPNEVAIKEIDRHLKRLEQVYPVLGTEFKIQIDELSARLQNLGKGDEEKTSLVDEIEKHSLIDVICES